MNVSLLTVTEGDDQFYPTPDALAEKMLTGLDWRLIETILEPSAGKGNLVECAIKANRAQGRYDRHNLDIDCIEIDPYLRQILKYNFCGQRHDEIINRISELRKKEYYDHNQGKKVNLNSIEQAELRKLELDANNLNSAAVHVIHDDFLTYRGRNRYDLILMNPPFADGDKHLLKAIEIQSNGGAIVCLLNAETLRNPYTKTRQILKHQLDKYDAKVEYVENSFSKAERRTDVSIAIVRVTVPRPVYKSTIYERMEKAAQQEEIRHEATELVISDYLEQYVQRYNVEVAASLELIKEYEALKPYITETIAEHQRESGGAILTLTVGTDSNYRQEVDVNKYLRKVRLKYWNFLFKNEQFTGKLTTNLRKMYLETVDKMADYDFTMHNIKTVMLEMNAGLIDGVKETIIALFDKLTVEHSWYPETKSNIHYFDGWKTNKAHKIGKKSIIPTHGMFSSYSWSKSTFDVSTAYSVISDIEKVFNYLDGGLTQDVDLRARLESAEREGRTRNIECKYFKVDLFKKGTTHIKYTNLDLVEKLNIYVAKNKKWLPPNYGRSTYTEMSADEKAVIDSFQGEAEYKRIMTVAGYFLSEPTKSVAMLNAPAVG
ncbi:MAG: DUF4942 domain-containing protein [Sporomusa sp.]